LWDDLIYKAFDWKGVLVNFRVVVDGFG